MSAPATDPDLPFLRDAGVPESAWTYVLGLLRDAGMVSARQVRDSWHDCTDDEVRRLWRLLELHEEVYVDYDVDAAWSIPHTTLQLCILYQIHPAEVHGTKPQWDDIRAELLPDLDGSLRGTDLKSMLESFTDRWSQVLDRSLVRLYVSLTVVEAAMEESVSQVRYDLCKVRDEEKDSEQHGNANP